MLQKSDFFKLGDIRKTHGVKGEMMLAAELFLDFDAIKEYLFFNIDECLIPFRLSSYRETSDKTLLFICPAITTVEQAAEYVGTEVYLPNADRTAAKDSNNPFMLIGFEVIEDETNKSIGTISNFIESNYNPLLEIEDNNGNEILLPFNEEFILGIEGDTIFVKIPEGLLELDED